MSKSESGFIRATAVMDDGTNIQLENWESTYPDSPTLWWAIGAYPRAKHDSGRQFGPRKGGTFRLTISFDTDAEAVEAFEKLNRGEAELLDCRDKFWNGERDAELLEV